VLILGLALLLATVGVASFPCWGYSRGWGYLPAATTAILLFGVALLAVGGKPAAKEPNEARIAASPTRAALD